MKQLFLSFIICIISLPTCFCQNFDKIVKQSTNFFVQNEIQKFEETYPLLYIEYLKKNLPEYQDALKATRKEDIQLAMEKIRELINEDIFLDEIVDDSNFSSTHNSKEWDAVLQTIEARTQNYNETIRQELKRIQNRDQGIRLLYLNTKDDSLKTAIHDYMKVVDNESAETVCHILDQYGWLGADEIGMEANETLFLAIQHVDDLKVQEKYLPILQKAVKEGKAEGWHLAFLTDRILMNQGKKQIYGTQKILASNPEDSYLIPLQYPDKVDHLRQEIGLSPLNEDLKECGMKWDPDEYRKNLPGIEKKYKEYHDSMK